MAFDDYSLAVGYDDVNYLKLVFEADLPEELQPQETVKDIETTFWGNYFADIDIRNPIDETISPDDAVVVGLDLYLSNTGMGTYKLDDIELSGSVKDNCKAFDGEYIERNGYACLITRQVDQKLNVVILHGDILNADQDELSRIEIYVE
ncbi:MAG: hypothetical protein IKS51_01615 [Erysipelotrichaceae bacterium]|nr:hypothetical protein [Erysipelotrichaceae bacterium]